MEPKAYLYNDLIKITGFNNHIESMLSRLLTYTDKSKEYQLRRAQRNRFFTRDLIEQLSQEVNGCLLENNGQELIVPSGFFNDVLDLIKDYEDRRHDTGKIVPLPWASSTYSFQLRPYQEEAVEAAVNNWRGIVNFATGLGKTKTAIGLIRRLKRKTLVVCPNRSIANQFYAELVAAFGAHQVGFVGDGKYKPSTITVGIAKSVVNKLDKIKKEWDLGMVIVDEVHRIAATTFFSIAKELSGVGRFYGLSATAYRSDGKDVFIHAGCGPILVERDVKWGVANGWLAKPIFIMRKIITGAKDYKDDKLKNYKAHVLRSDITNQRIIADAKAFIANGKQTLILVDQIEHGRYLADTLEIPFATGEDGNADELIEDLNSRKIIGLIATDGVVGEGVDTRTVEVLILANFIAAKGAVMQAVGRALRIVDNKTSAIILDYDLVDSTMLHRHAGQRLKIYKDITKDVKLL